MGIGFFFIEFPTDTLQGQDADRHKAAVTPVKDMVAAMEVLQEFAAEVTGAGTAEKLKGITLAYIGGRRQPAAGQRFDADGV